MAVSRDFRVQYCPNQTHDGVPGKKGTAPTRAFWPYNHFDAAVAEWRKMKPTAGEAVELPLLEVTLEV